MIGLIPSYGHALVVLLALLPLGVLIRGLKLCRDIINQQDEDVYDIRSVEITPTSNRTVINAWRYIGLQSKLANPNIDVVVMHYLDASMSRSNRVKPLVNIALLYGLAGTILGLIIMFGSMNGVVENAMSADNQRQYFENAGLIIGSIQYAFASSFAGVLSSIILGSRLKSVEERQASLDSEVTGWLIQKASSMWPKALPEVMDELNKIVTETTDKLRISQTEANGLIDETRAVFTGLGNSIRTLPSAMESVTTHFGKVSKVAGTMSDSLDKAAKETEKQRLLLMNMQADLLKSFEISMTAFEAENTKQIALVKNLQLEFSQNTMSVRESMDLTRDMINTAVGAMQVFMEQMQTNTRDISSEVLNAVRVLNDISIPFSSIIQQIGDTTDILSRIETSTHPSLEVLSIVGDSATKLASESSNVVQNMKAISEALSNINSDAGTVQRIYGGLTQLSDHITSLDSTIMGYIEVIDSHPEKPTEKSSDVGGDKSFVNERIPLMSDQDHRADRNVMIESPSIVTEDV